MTGLEARLDSVTDRLSPIVVKELRQALRAKAFMGAFAALLTLCVFVSLVVPLDDPEGSPAGRDLFAVYVGGLVVIALLVLPISTFRSFSKELADETWPSLALTPLGAQRIVRGRIVSTTLQCAIYASAVGPFLFFSWMLDGVSLTSVFAALLLVALVQPLVSAFAVCAATFAQHRTMRSLLFMGLLAGLVPAAGGGFGLVADLARGMSVAGSWEQLAEWGLLVWAVATLTWLIAEVGAARIAASSENTVRGPRLAILLHLAGPLVAVYVTRTLNPGSGDELAAAALVYPVVLAYLVGAAGLGEPAVAPAAVRPTSRWTLFVPGRRGALRFATLLSFGSAAVLLPASEMDFTVAIFVALPALVVLHLAISVVLLAVLPDRVSGTADPRRLVPLVVTFLLMAGPPLLQSVLFGNPLDPVLNLLNPIVIALNAKNGDATWVPFVLLALAVPALLVGDRLLADEERAALALEAARR